MINVKCTRCGVVNFLSNETCKACDLELSASSIPNGVYETPHAQYAEARRGRPPFIASIKPGVGVGEVLGSSITLFSRNIWLISKLVLVIVTPFEIFKTLSVPDFAGNWQLAVGTLALQIFCNILIAPALIYALMRVMQTGVAPGINESYRWGLSKLGKVGVVALMSLTLETLGLALCVIPGIFLFLAFELVYPIATLEDCSPVEVLKRSYKITKGYRWNIFGATLLMSILAAVAGAPGSILVMQLARNGVDFWPIQVLVAIIADILSQGSTILALVIYLSILRTLESAQSVIE
jgi:uncharacterized membrane protein